MFLIVFPDRKENTMKHIIAPLILLTTLLQIANVMAAESIVGTWQGKLVTSPGAEMNIQFIITQESTSSYSAILNSPDEGGIKNIKASSVAFNSGTLKLDAVELNGFYEGVLKNGKIDGKWKQEGSSFPLMLSSYAKPTFSKKDMDTLLGSWNGKLAIPGGTLTAIFRFEMSQKGEFVGFSDWPDNGGYGAPIADMEISDGNLSLKIPIINGEYKGKFTDNKIIGELRKPEIPVPLPLTLEKGEYIPPGYALSLPKDIMEQLLGRWKGEMAAWDKKSAPNKLVFRFEKSKNGDFTGFVDMSVLGAKGMPVTEATLSDGKLTLKIKAALPSEFKGQLSGDKLAGEWKARNDTIPLLLTKEKP
jgi:hypothetical protein